MVTIDPAEAPASRPRRRGLRIAVVALAAAMLTTAAVAGYLIYRQPDRSETTGIYGSLTLRSIAAFERLDEFSCAGTDGYDDLHQGANVVIKDPHGTIIATGSLAAGAPADFVGGDGSGPGIPTSCQFRFDVEGVPKQRFYTVEVSHRGAVTYSAAQVDARSLDQTLGS